MQQTKLQLNMPSLESSRKKVQLWGKPRELQEMSLVIQPFPGNTHQSHDLVFLVIRAFLS